MCTNNGTPGLAIPDLKGRRNVTVTVNQTFSQSDEGPLIPSPRHGNMEVDGLSDEQPNR